MKFDYCRDCKVTLCPFCKKHQKDIIEYNNCSSPIIYCKSCDSLAVIASPKKFKNIKCSCGKTRKIYKCGTYKILRYSDTLLSSIINPFNIDIDDYIVKDIINNRDNIEDILSKHRLDRQQEVKTAKVYYIDKPDIDNILSSYQNRYLPIFTDLDFTIPAGRHSIQAKNISLVLCENNNDETFVVIR